MLGRALGHKALLAGLVVASGCIIVQEGGNGGGESQGGGGASQASYSDDTSSGPSDDGSSSAAPTYYVYGYRDAYRSLPDMGETKDYFRAHGNRAQVDRGYFNGDWHCGPEGMIKEGAGAGETVIDGHLEIKGNNWVLRGCTITGDVKVRGNNNDLSGCEVLGDIDVRGVGNMTP